MRILAFETSCDDTSVALFEGKNLLALSTKSQIMQHAQTAGVVPEVAARLHENVIFDAIDAIFAESGTTLAEVEHIACTTEPGLMPSLLVGMTVAKTLAHELGVPLIPVNHIHAHILANWLERESDEIPLPAVCLTVSGGHTELYRVDDFFSKTTLGRTRDDAAGEAFDKVAKMLGLGFPGGPHVAGYSAEHAREFRGIFPLPLLAPDSLDFSFSGLKSAVRREIEIRMSERELTLDDIREICHEFEMRVVEILVHKTMLAAKREAIQSVLIAGGVSANDRLQTRLAEECEKNGLRFFVPVKKIYSLDNAAMVGMTAYLHITRGESETKS